jgi:hypothetical protein
MPAKSPFCALVEVLGPRAVERELHVLGRHLGPVVEPHALAQVEGVDDVPSSEMSQLAASAGAIEPSGR